MRLTARAMQTSSVHIVHSRLQVGTVRESYVRTTKKKQKKNQKTNRAINFIFLVRACALSLNNSPWRDPHRSNGCVLQH